MTNLSRETCFKLRDARRAAGIKQSDLASELGCTQSGISMFEQGDGTKLNDEVIEKMAKRFGVELKYEKTGRTAGTSGTAGTLVEPRIAAIVSKGFCPNPHCPSHQVYEIEGKTYLRPNRAEQDPVGGKFCAVCGEVLERACPNCCAPVHDGAVCSICGQRYITT